MPKLIIANSQRGKKIVTRAARGSLYRGMLKWACWNDSILGYFLLLLLPSFGFWGFGLSLFYGDYYPSWFTYSNNNLAYSKVIGFEFNIWSLFLFILS